MAPATCQLYEPAARLHVQPALGEVRLGELTPTVIDRALSLVRVNKGTQPARAARRALSSLCADAVRHGAISHNPAHDSRTHRLPAPAGAGPDPCRSQTWPSAPCTSTLPSSVSPAPGCRPSRATKTTPSQRVLALPLPVLDTRRHRRLHGAPNGPAGVVFPSPTGQLRDPSNTQADVRGALDRAGYPWVTSHTFRRTVASRLDDAGFSIRHMADQLGHARPSTTLDHYLGRRAITTTDHAAALYDLAARR